MEFIKGLLKWIILAIIFIIIIVLIIKYANRNQTPKKVTTEPTVNIVNNNNNNDNDVDENVSEDGLVPIQEDLTVDSPDTASSATKEVVIGMFILGCAANYIYKRRTVKGNS